MAPETLWLDDNHEEVLGFLYYYRWRTFLKVKPEPGRPRRAVVDLSRVKAVGLDAALALTAEYHRHLLLAPNFFPCIDDAHWPPHVRKLFRTLGFYDLVRASGTTADPEEEGPDFPLKFVRFVGAESVDGEVADGLMEELKMAAGQAPARMKAYGALMEAVKNVCNHAYPADAPPRIDHVVPRWWAAGAYFPNDRQLQFAVYDQGVGIPATLGPKPAYLKILSSEGTDARIIRGAIELGRTRTELDERGNGLWTICQLVRELPGSNVTIWSGRGQVTYSSRGRTHLRDFENPFCGTLILWTLQLPQEPTPVGLAA